MKLSAAQVALLKVLSEPDAELHLPYGGVVRRNYGRHWLRPHNNTIKALIKRELIAETSTYSRGWTETYNHETEQYEREDQYTHVYTITDRGRRALGINS